MTLLGHVQFRGTLGWTFSTTGLIAPFPSKFSFRPFVVAQRLCQGFYARIFDGVVEQVEGWYQSEIRRTNSATHAAPIVPM